MPDVDGSSHDSMGISAKDLLTPEQQEKIKPVAKRLTGRIGELFEYARGEGNYTAEEVEEFTWKLVSEHSDLLDSDSSWTELLKEAQKKLFGSLDFSQAVEAISREKLYEAVNYYLTNPKKTPPETIEAVEIDLYAESMVDAGVSINLPLDDVQRRLIADNIQNLNREACEIAQGISAEEKNRNARNKKISKLRAGYRDESVSRGKNLTEAEISSRAEEYARDLLSRPTKGNAEQLREYTNVRQALIPRLIELYAQNGWTMAHNFLVLFDETDKEEKTAVKALAHELANGTYLEKLI